MRPALGWLVLCAGCEVAWAQPRARRDAGVRARDAGVRAREDVVVRAPTRGRVDPAAVRPLVASVNPAVQRCYEQALARDPTARGEVEVRVRVEEDGRVSETAGRTEDTSLREATRCIERALAGLRFPRPTGGAATVVVPYRFSASE